MGPVNLSKFLDCHCDVRLHLERVLLLALLCLAGGNAWPQANTAPDLLKNDATCPSPVPPPQIPANPLLVGHTNFFCPVKVYDLKNDSNSKGSFPAGLNYTVYSAV